MQHVYSCVCWRVVMYELASVLTVSCMSIPQAARRMNSSSALPTLQPQVRGTHCRTLGSV